MINKIIKRIYKYGFNDYIVSRALKNEVQLYLLKDKIESERKIESEQYEITVYLDHQDNGQKFRGSYTFMFKASEDLDQYLKEAQIGARLIKNRPYLIIGPQKIPKVKVYDQRLANAKDLAQEIARIIYRNSSDDNVCLSSAEIFITSSMIELWTSTGIEAKKNKGRIDLDITLLSRNHKKEAEVNFNIMRRNFDDLNLPDLFLKHKVYAKDMLDVQVPKSAEGLVIFPTADIYKLFYPVIFHSSARAKDIGVSRFVLGEKITTKPIIGNTVTLEMSGCIPYGLYTEPFDDEGIPSKDVTIIKDGVFKKYWATKQFADYLGLEPTGSFKNMIIKTDTKQTNSIDPVLSNGVDFNGCYEIIQFSDFSPDPLTGDFVAEIRFGYYYKNDKKIPIKGGSISGNLFDRLNEIHLSGKEAFEGDYLGPERIALGNLTIAGD